MAAVLFSSTMSQNTTTNVNDDVKPTIFHDFLGRQCAPLLHCAAADGGSPSPSASRAGGAPISTTSDLDSDRQVGSHLEGVPFYGQRNDFSPSEIRNRYAGSKRSNSDYVFMGSSRDGVPQIRPDFPENSHLMKVLSNIGQQEQLKRPHEVEAFMAAHPIRPTSKWERAIPVNVGPLLQYPPRAGQAVPNAYQTLSNRFKDANVGSVISQSAADQGSRTGIKGSGILSSSINVNGGVAEPAIGKQKSVISVPEPGSSSPLRRQMTIFYGGQAHVFDDVHPNKADAIMALAGSTGASWSTSYSNSVVKPARPSGENIPVTGENTGMAASNSGLPRGRFYVAGSSSPGAVSNDRRSMPHGGHGGVLMADPRQRTTRAAVESSTEEKL
ncbi:Tify [Cynara cardunculus var. scolymus]|uniref:Protein TIFY n=1 Tax=Cynara cardunculus var. scolymus TaxID=59895 RepID=A0A103XZN8_CYNCS|nr:Tify [Cynara cardunculus var. scolymus]